MVRILFITIILGCYTALSFGADSSKNEDFKLSAADFSNNQILPKRYTCNGENIPPALTWANAPEKTRSFALLVYNPDAPMGTYYLWVLYNIPANITSIEQGDNLPAGTLLGKNSLNDTMYHGPCPPDENTYHYVFALYALDEILDLANGSDIYEILPKIKYHTLKRTELTATFNH